MVNREKIVRIGCGSGFWGDTPEGARQLIHHGELDYLILDYLAEVTMSILARAKEKTPGLGYATDFVSQVIRPYASAIASQKLKVVVNAGGVNPQGCVAAILKELELQGVQLKVAAVTGDDVLAQQQDWRDSGLIEMFNGCSVPPVLISANAYLGAFPIAAALARGADIVVTGRCVDSALALAPLIHEFGWQPGDLDLLSAGTLAGHVLECGAQCTGGFSTDWEEVSGTWATIGFPIAECASDGSFIVTKPEGTGGAVNVQGVTEQITYETGDPAAYKMPDVVCDWRHVSVVPAGVDRVSVSGARGQPPTSSYKVSATYEDGFRCVATLLVRGMDAARKARAIAEAILQRSSTVLLRDAKGDFSEASVEVLGAEDAYGPRSKTLQSREVVLKVGVKHPNAKALETFSREVFPTSTSTVQGVSGVFGGRPKVQPVVRLFSFLLDKERVPVVVSMDGKDCPVDRVAGNSASPGAVKANEVRDLPSTADAEASTRVPLVAVAYGRSGDKGDISNIAVLARKECFLPFIRQQLTEANVKAYFAHIAKGDVERFEWPGLNGFNFLLHEALGGGGTASLRYDPQGKAHAQILMDFPIEIPTRLVTEDMANI